MIPRRSNCRLAPRDRVDPRDYAGGAGVAQERVSEREFCDNL
jgi:hypothetical protein